MEAIFNEYSTLLFNKDYMLIPSARSVLKLKEALQYWLESKNYVGLGRKVASEYARRLIDGKLYTLLDIALAIQDNMVSYMERNHICAIVKALVQQSIITNTSVLAKKYLSAENVDVGRAESPEIEDTPPFQVNMDIEDNEGPVLKKVSIILWYICSLATYLLPV